MFSDIFFLDWFQIWKYRPCLGKLFEVIPLLSGHSSVPQSRSQPSSPNCFLISLQMLFPELLVDLGGEGRAPSVSNCVFLS